MTNPHPITIGAVGVYCIALKTALMSNDKTIIFKKALGVAKTDIIKNILANSLGGPDPVKALDGQYAFTDSKFIEYVGIALQNEPKTTFYELMRGTSFYNSLIGTISRGGRYRHKWVYCWSIIRSILWN